MGCTVIVQIELKNKLQLFDRCFNILLLESKCRFKYLLNQLEIDYLEEIFLEILEIFLAAVFLLMMPDLATCIRID